jgi:hypothetical protein
MIGVGEKIDDLRDFEPEMFVDALLGIIYIFLARGVESCILFFCMFTVFRLFYRWAVLLYL